MNSVLAQLEHDLIYAPRLHKLYPHMWSAIHLHVQTPTMRTVWTRVGFMVEEQIIDSEGNGLART